MSLSTSLTDSSPRRFWSYASPCVFICEQAQKQSRTSRRSADAGGGDVQVCVHVELENIFAKNKMWATKAEKQTASSSSSNNNNSSTKQQTTKRGGRTYKSCSLPCGQLDALARLLQEHKSK